jgi:citrate lyase subunit beta / citryl-CoA lyase
MLGNLDLTAELSLESRSDELELLYARSRVVVASAAAGLVLPIDGVFTDTRDGDGFLRAAAMVRTLGFGGKLCIHPSRVLVANNVFVPTGQQIRWAETIISAVEANSSTGAFTVNGVND